MDVKQQGETIEGKVGIMKSRGAGSEVLVYAPMVELGTSRHPPYPYLLPAAEVFKGRVGNYFKK